MFLCNHIIATDVLFTVNSESIVWGFLQSAFLKLIGRQEMKMSDASTLIRKYTPFFKIASEVRFQNVGCLAFAGSLPKNI